MLFTACFGQVPGPSPSRSGSRTGRGTIPLESNKDQGVYATSRGVVKSVSKNLLFLRVDEEHEMKFRITRKTKFLVQDKDGTHELKPSSLEPGQAIAVDAQTALDGSFEAVRVLVEAPNPLKSQ